MNTGAMLGVTISLAIHVAAAIAVWPGWSADVSAGRGPAAVDSVHSEAGGHTSETRRPAEAGHSAPEASAETRRLVDHLWQSTLMALVIGLSTIAFRSNDARVRYWLWFSASAKFLIPFSVVAALGSMLPFAPTVQAITSSAEWLAPVASSSPPIVSPAFALPAPASDSGSNAWRVVLLAIWACGSVGIVLSRLGTWRRIRRLVGASRPIDLIDFVMPGVRVHGAPGLLEPAVVGLWRPILLLPVGIDRHLTLPQLHAVIAHELSHIRRRDNLTAAVHMVVEAVFWFHPLVWWIGARLIAERERACDEDVLEGFEPRGYVDAIVSICRRYVDAPIACVSGVSGSDLQKRIEAIMTNERRAPITFSKRLLLVTSMALVLVVPLGIGAASASGVSAQPAAASQAPAAFEVASVKPNVAPNRGGPFGPQPGGRFVATNSPVSYLIRFAYEPSPWSRDLDAFQMTGGPDWMTVDRFDVNAKAAGDLPLVQMRRMVQALLVERFKLRVHQETRELPIYRLVVARGDGRLGPKLRPTQLTCAASIDLFAGFQRGAAVPCGYFGMSPTIDPGSGQSEWAFRGMTMEGFARRLQSFLGRTIADHTGLAGYYDGDFEFAAEIAIPPPPPGRPNPYADRVFPSIFSVLPQQLGLRLESGRGPVEVLVIDSIERPTEN
jgi:uncharacterized protein (TIGR03435 family)